MKILIAVALLVIGLPAGADNTDSAAHPALKTAAPSGASKADAEWMKAFRAGDVEATTRCYAPDAMVWVAGAPLAKGTQAIRAQYQAYFAAYTIKDVSVHELGSTTVGAESVGWGSFSISAQPKAGGPVEVENGRYTEVAQHRGGHWIYTVDHASDEPAAAAP